MCWKKPGQMFLTLKSYWTVLVPSLCAMAGRCLSLQAPVSGSMHFFSISEGSHGRFLGGGSAVNKEGLVCWVLVTRKLSRSSLCRASLLL